MPKYDYDILVIGGGAAGLTSSGICASFGARTALVEKKRLGGDCTWTGCVPSKSLLHIAAEVASVKAGQAAGITFSDLQVDFKTVMETVRSTRQKVYEDADSPELMQAKGVTVLEGTASFFGPHAITLEHEGNKQTLTFRSAIIASGATSLIIPIPGLDTIPYLTNDSLFELEKQPKHLVILGSGPIGLEMAQAFRRLGSQVTVIALDERLLIRDEPSCAEFVKDQLEREGIVFRSGETIHKITRKSESSFELDVGPLQGSQTTFSADALLVAVGRKVATAQLGLKNAGVHFDKTGIPVDKHCRTNVKHIFAAGDITTFLKFTHVAENMAKTAAINAVFRLSLFSHERRVVPWVTFTEPECAHVGETASELESRGVRFDTIEFPYSKIDRAVTERKEAGVVIVHVAKSGRILGAHAAGAQAGELINEYALAMKNGLKLSKISDTIHAYPTMLLGARRAADQFYVRLQKRWMIRLFKTILGFRGEIPAYIGSKEIQ